MKTYTPNPNQIKKSLIDLSDEEIEARKNLPPLKPDREEVAGIRVDGFGQILEMLSVADADFRISLLRRIASRDPQMFKRLATELKRTGVI